MIWKFSESLATSKTKVITSFIRIKLGKPKKTSTMSLIFQMKLWPFLKLHLNETRCSQELKRTQPQPDYYDSQDKLLDHSDNLKKMKREINNLAKVLR